MKMTFRWYGPKDPIPLSYIRQIPCMTGVVSAIYDPVSYTHLDVYKRQVESQGMILAADVGDAAKVLFLDDSVPAGAKIR